MDLRTASCLIARSRPSSVIKQHMVTQNSLKSLPRERVRLSRNFVGASTWKIRNFVRFQRGCEYNLAGFNYPTGKFIRGYSTQKKSESSRIIEKSYRYYPAGFKIPTGNFYINQIGKSRGGFFEDGFWERGTGLEPTMRSDGKGVSSEWGPWGIPITFHKPDGNVSVFVLPNFWLRDNCRCAKCVNGDTMQRAFDTFSIPADVMPSKVHATAGGLNVKWEHDLHESFYSWRWLRRQMRKATGKVDDSLPSPDHDPSITLWTQKIGVSPPSVPYRSILASDEGVAAWTQNIREFGFCYVDDCPVDPVATQKLLERIAFIRGTHYGGFYDFTSDLTMKDTAYTSLALEAHTDTTYFTDPAGLQMFHLLSHTQGTGGESLLVDGFKAAKLLLEESPEDFHILATVPVPSHASGNEGINITPSKSFPVLNFGNASPLASTSLPGHNGAPLLQIRWNNDDRGVMPTEFSGGIGVESWYNAARKWNEILKREDMQYWAQLEPGRPIIFDNWRVLHGRSAFTGKRRICGGYVNRDDYVSRWLNTKYAGSPESVLRHIL